MNRLWFLAAVVFAVTFASLACGGGGSEPTESSEPTDSGQSQAPAASGAPAQTETTQASSGSDAEVVFADPLLEEGIREEIGKLEGPLLVSDLEGLTTFSMGLRLYVEDLSGIENMTNLTEIDFTQNKLTDISPLASLTNLTGIDVSQNSITDISPVAGLVNLTSLRVQDNEVTDISAVAGLTKLTRLNLQANQISDISALSELTELTELKLANNNISDLSSLSNMSKLTFLELSRNNITDLSPLLDAGLPEGAKVRLWGEPLDDNSKDVVIPQLEAAGVKVEF